MTERIRKVFIQFMKFTVKSEDMNELAFGAATSCISGRN